MMQRVGMAIGAGLAAALLFAVKGTLLAMALACLAPLPIVIATLGWGLDMGALAAAIASVGAAVVVDPLAGGWFAVSIGLPAWLLSFLGQLRRGRLFAFYPFAVARTDDKTWFPVGDIVAVAALIGAIVGAGALASLVLVYGGYHKGVDALAAELVPELRGALDGAMTLPGGVSVEEFAALIVRARAMTCAPAPASATATARPTPREAPVTNATRLPSFMLSSTICCAADRGGAAPPGGALRQRRLTRQKFGRRPVDPVSIRPRYALRCCATPPSDARFGVKEAIAG